MGVRFTMWAVNPMRLLDMFTADEVSKAREDSLSLQSALRRASGASEAHGIVQLILDGHRRWWVGSLLESLRKSSPWLLSQRDVEHAEHLLSSILRGWNCGTTVRAAPPSLSRCSFPIVPKNDADLRSAVLSPSDFEFLRGFFDERLRDEDRRFVRPSGVIGIAPESDDAWDSWVREVLRAISTTPLEIADPTLVSLLG